MEKSYLNALYNRQYVFNLDEYAYTHPEITYNAKVLYNSVNQIQIANFFQTTQYKGDLKTTLAFPKLLFSNTSPKVLLDYNMTNGVLPKYIFCKLFAYLKGVISTLIITNNNFVTYFRHLC
jgi:hypothetical protein